MDHLFFLNCHSEGAVIKGLSQRHTHTLPVTQFALHSASLKCATVLPNKGNNVSLLLVSGSNEINQSLGEESACASLFCHQCRDIGGGRDEPDVNQKTFSAPRETRFRHYQPWPSVTLNSRTMTHYGALRGLNRLTDRKTCKGVHVFLCNPALQKLGLFISKFLFQLHSCDKCNRCLEFRATVFAKKCYILPMHSVSPFLRLARYLCKKPSIMFPLNILVVQNQLDKIRGTLIDRHRTLSPDIRSQEMIR